MTEVGAGSSRSPQARSGALPPRRPAPPPGRARGGRPVGGGPAPPPRGRGLTGEAQVVLRVAMTCGGCSGAVERVLAKMEGVESYDVNLETQKVVVKGDVTPQAVLEKVAKTGKATEFWS